MSQLFQQLYLDEDVDVLIADLVRARGFIAVTTQEAAHLGSSDEEQLAYAINMQSTFLTHNRKDFEKLAGEYFATGKEHYGIIIAVRHSPYEIVRRLLLIMNNVTADEMKNQIRFI
jgi:predicted nuclease of predicted toxin-antitoxin system